MSLGAPNDDAQWTLTICRVNPRINYGTRRRRGRPDSTATVGFAVNQVLNQRVCKRYPMRWSPIEAHLPAQVQCAVINDDLVQGLARYEPPIFTSSSIGAQNANVHPCM